MFVICLSSWDTVEFFYGLYGVMKHFLIFFNILHNKIFAGPNKSSISKFAHRCTVYCTVYILYSIYSMDTFQYLT